MAGIKYQFVRVFTRKDFAQDYKKKLEKQGYKCRLITERIKGGKQYVLYRSREKVK